MRETLPGESTFTIDTNTYEALPFSDRCRDIWRRGDHLLIGVSPGNSYFSHRRIAELIGWGREFFERIDIVHADLHVGAQYEAFGYDAERAERRAVKEVKATARRIARGAEDAGSPDGVRMHALSEFAGHPVYRRLHRQAVDALGTDREFREAAEGMARGFLAARMDEGLAPNEPQLAAGLRYITAELPFFLDTPALLGVPSSVSCYHLQLPLTPVLFGRDEGLRAAPAQGYAVVRPAAPSGPVGVVAETSVEPARAA
ncbi:tRNA-dependent cyclodipeptide synthase [Streptomyces sp. CB01881]|uniref:tRNA-dependent cyclodipeptide synthase n=1 Tax=Streptomyces sp. CB01881 TaxID=2078691 RepID=UPI000CDCBA07|nr:tRNA-dependent cyclodipeptide synthase [Streptomyces sp. CB01881]AUY48967.1 tRNA-dependent cyclodipeptide synthase [Streptomyces sp. CB01881]TYC77456.1 tRNA-dependent cyclodipeptide synthase [Streptomyces sp. CB01881]